MSKVFMLIKYSSHKITKCEPKNVPLTVERFDFYYGIDLCDTNLDSQMLTHCCIDKKRGNYFLPAFPMRRLNKKPQ